MSHNQFFDRILPFQVSDNANSVQHPQSSRYARQRSDMYGLGAPSLSPAYASFGYANPPQPPPHPSSYPQPSIQFRDPFSSPADGYSTQGPVTFPSGSWAPIATGGSSDFRAAGPSCGYPTFTCIACTTAPGTWNWHVPPSGFSPQGSNFHGLFSPHPSGPAGHTSTGSPGTRLGLGSLSSYYGGTPGFLSGWDDPLGGWSGSFGGQPPSPYEGEALFMPSRTGWGLDPLRPSRRAEDDLPIHKLELDDYGESRLENSRILDEILSDFAQTERPDVASVYAIQEPGFPSRRTYVIAREDDTNVRLIVSNHRRSLDVSKRLPIRGYPAEVGGISASSSSAEVKYSGSPSRTASPLAVTIQAERPELGTSGVLDTIE